MRRIFVKGDYHGQFKGLKDFCKKAETTTDDILVLLGDVGVNYTLKVDDFYLKRSLAKLPITLIMVHGNHEERPQNVRGYKLIASPYGMGQMWHNDAFPNQYFFDNGVYTIFNKTILVLGGAYSVDKEYRLMNGHKWFKSEQLTEEERGHLSKVTYNGVYDFVFSHTCPLQYIPRDMFLPMINQESVDNTMENFLQAIHDQITFEHWYCGHWHTDRMVDNFHFVYHDYKEIYYEG